MDEAVILELILRGIGAGILLLLGLQFVRMGRSRCMEIAGFAFCILGAMHAIAGHNPAFATLIPGWSALMVLGRLDSVAFWILVMAMFDEGFEMRPVHLLPGVAIVTSLLSPISEICCGLITMALMVHVMSLALRDREGDLVDIRRRFRMALAVVVPLMIISSIVTGWLTPPGAALVYLLDTLKITGLAVFFGTWMLRMDDDLIHSPAPEEHVAPRTVPPADLIEMQRLRAAVEGGICFEPGLTIGALAARLDIPEHRLRRLINQGLGYRNFAAFLNDHRIEEAKRRLADPAQARAQIVSHAFALGYNSLAPFNRAFRERVGQSPTAYRTAVLGEIAAQ
ncbi:helix-turn-helix domain-containing protein [Roseobacter sp. HKCCA0434]|uniref:AraC family transcriptional regulator n=1 Tax=Roseobacter sp. HKCCA0434 TaxID=3079297 RepID=UPI002905D0DB|nr:helix-turn-helix domain-containing protein [Roseobacter sp. HKCCA0434]